MKHKAKILITTAFLALTLTGCEQSIYTNVLSSKSSDSVKELKLKRTGLSIYSEHDQKTFQILRDIRTGELVALRNGYYYTFKSTDLEVMNKYKMVVKRENTIEERFLGELPPTDTVLATMPQSQKQENNNVVNVIVNTSEQIEQQKQKEKQKQKEIENLERLLREMKGE